MYDLMEEQRVELEFRDGRRSVPLYLANYMEHLDTYLFTYAAAVDEANREMLREKETAVFDKHIAMHFREHR